MGNKPKLKPQTKFKSNRQETNQTPRTQMSRSGNKLSIIKASWGGKGSLSGQWCCRPLLPESL